MEAKKLMKPHAMLMPYPLQGHVIPFVHLAMKLASNGFTITFVNTHAVHHQITKANAADTTKDLDIFAHARNSGLDIRYLTIYDGFPVEFDRSLNHDQYFEAVMHGIQVYVDEVVGKLVHAEPRLNCIISDTFYVWSPLICEKYSLINTTFWTEPALVFTLYYHMHLLKTNGHFASHDNRKDTIDYIPGVGAIEPTDLPSYLQAKDEDIWGLVNRILYKSFGDMSKTNFILCNTVQELESETILAIQEKQPFFAIGPVFHRELTKNTVTTNMWAESNCTMWLNSKPHGSVLYVSFGSYAHLSKQELLDIAQGLALSNVSFIWVLRPDIISSNDIDPLPVGFKDEVKDRGLIISWCSQIDVISHPGIGGFVTHCGWNSILESIWCGVPLLCFPLLTDQITNRKLVVDDLRIGLNLCDKKPITKEEVAKKIDLLMSGKCGDQMKVNVKDVKTSLGNALSAYGSSQRNFNQFIQDVKVQLQKNHEIAK